MKIKNNKDTLSNVTLSGVEVGVEEQKDKNLITRKESLIKTSKYVVYTALSTFIILNPKKAQAQSTPDNPGY
ncbi:MAG: hypothetical protein QM486_05150 [Flavobacteriaceae bacterium]